MPDAKIRAVFDCNTFIQALFNSSGTAGECFELVRREEITLFVSQDILLEIREVLQRPNLIARFPSITLERIDAFLEEILSFAVEIRNVPRRFQYERDPQDEPYLNLAIEAEADYIVSWDNDLLDLMSGTTVECKEFRQKFRLLKITPPTEFLQILSKEAKLL